jgi:hypothetical protein
MRLPAKTLVLALQAQEATERYQQSMAKACITAALVVEIWLTYMPMKGSEARQEQTLAVAKVTQAQFHCSQLDPASSS